MKKYLTKILALMCVLIMTMCSLCGCFFLDDDEEETTTAKTGQQDPTKATSENPTAGTTTIFPSSMVREHLNDVSKAQSVTVLVYMNGSNLESEYSEATTDLSEMVSATQSDKVNVIVQTMGTKKWDSKYGILPTKSQRYKVVNNGLELVDNSLPQLDCTAAATLLDFIKWGVAKYPADRYMLVFWNHGGGPVYGFGYDEWNKDSSASLTIDEMQVAITSSGVKFDIIGMDCCIMSSLEVCMALYDCCDYMILSEEFESGLGWSYKGWLSALAKNPAISSYDVAKIAIDDNIAANKNSSEGDSAALAFIDESMIKVLYTAWKEFAYANEEALLNSNFSQKVQGERGLNAMRSDDNPTLSDYFITDIMAVAQNIQSAEVDALSAALANTILYFNSYRDSAMTGMSVTLPYGDSNFYSSLKNVFAKCGIENEYITWLQKFTTASGSSSYYDYDSWEDGEDWDWEDWDEDYDWEDWDYYDDDDYWDDDSDDSSWGWLGGGFLSFWDSLWYDDYWEDEYDANYWYDEDDDFWDDDDWDWDDWDWDDDDWDDWDEWDYDDWDWDDWGWGSGDDWDDWDW